MSHESWAATCPSPRSARVLRRRPRRRACRRKMIELVAVSTDEFSVPVRPRVDSESSIHMENTEASGARDPCRRWDARLDGS